MSSQHTGDAVGTDGGGRSAQVQPQAQDKPKLKPTSRPLVRRWWVWALVLVLVAGGSVGAVVWHSARTYAADRAEAQDRLADALTRHAELLGDVEAGLADAQEVLTGSVGLVSDDEEVLRDLLAEQIIDTQDVVAQTHRLAVQIPDVEGLSRDQAAHYFGWVEDSRGVLTEVQADLLEAVAGVEDAVHAQVVWQRDQVVQAQLAYEEATERLFDVADYAEEVLSASEGLVDDDNDVRDVLNGLLNEAGVLLLTVVIDSADMGSDSDYVAFMQEATAQVEAITRRIEHAIGEVDLAVAEGEHRLAEEGPAQEE